MLEDFDSDLWENTEVSLYDISLIGGIESDFKNNTFVESHEFQREWERLGLTDDDLRGLQNLISSGKAPIIPLGSNIFKIRFSPKWLNKGKDTSMRSIYAFKESINYTYLITVFSKSEEANITRAKLQEIREQSDALFGSMR